MTGFLTDREVDVRILRGYILASVAGTIVFTLVLSALQQERNIGNILAASSVFFVYALMFTAVLAPLGLLLLRRLGRHGFLHFALAGLILGWLSTMVLLPNPAGLLKPMALAFGAAGLAAGFAFRAGYGPKHPLAVDDAGSSG